MLACYRWQGIPKAFRQLSSGKWAARQSSDRFVKEAAAAGYRCRSAFKLLEIDEKFKLFQDNKRTQERVSRVLDLGAAPGSWSQVAVERLKSNIKESKRSEAQIDYDKQIKVISVDLQFFVEVPGTLHLPHTDAKDYDKISAACTQCWGEDNKVQVVLSDMMHNLTGEGGTDHIKSVELCAFALKFAFQHLEKNGTVVLKVYQGSSLEKLEFLISRYFRTVNRFIPTASRKESRELFIIARGFKGYHKKRGYDLKDHKK